MFTRCPNCQQQQSLTVEQLRVSRAIVFCRRCSIKFDALEQLSNVAIDDSLDTDILPWEQPSGSTYWQLGLVIGIALLLAQLVYFEGYVFSQNTRLRPRLEMLCRHLGCRLPDYKNPNELILQGTVMPSSNYQYVVTAAINNQAAFAQPYPNIKLTLLNYNGSAFAHRIFHPQEYASGMPSATAVINAGATIAIQLDIAATKNHIGGYTFELTY